MRPVMNIRHTLPSSSDTLLRKGSRRPGRHIGHLGIRTRSDALDTLRIEQATITGDLPRLQKFGAVVLDELGKLHEKQNVLSTGELRDPKYVKLRNGSSRLRTEAYEPGIKPTRLRRLAAIAAIASTAITGSATIYGVTELFDTNTTDCTGSTEKTITRENPTAWDLANEITGEHADTRIAVAKIEEMNNGVDFGNIRIGDSLTVPERCI